LKEKIFLTKGLQIYIIEERALRKVLEEFLKSSGLRLDDSKFLKELLRESNLTSAQTETLLIEAAAANLGLKLSMEEKARIRGVSKGAYARTKRQAINNIKRSIYTILLLRSLRIMGDEIMASVIEAANFLAKDRIDNALAVLKAVTFYDVTK